MEGRKLNRLIVLAPLTIPENFIKIWDIKFWMKSYLAWEFIATINNKVPGPFG